MSKKGDKIENMHNGHNLSIVIEVSGKNMMHRSHVQIFGFTQVACTQINTVCKYMIYLFDIVPLLSTNILTLVNIIIDN